jgi:hypothetical protein
LIAAAALRFLILKLVLLLQQLPLSTHLQRFFDIIFGTFFFFSCSSRVDLIFNLTE